MWKLYASDPWILPLSMGLWNTVFFITTLMTEGRVKTNVAMYAIRYFSTIRAAKNGDLLPFISVLSEGR